MMVNLILPALTLIFLIFFFSYNPDTDWKYPKQFIFCLISAVLLCSFAFIEIPLTGIMALYSIVSSLYICALPSSNHSQKGVIGNRNYPFLNKITVHSLDMFVLVVAFLLMPKMIVKSFFDVAPILTMVGAFFTFYVRMVHIKRTGQSGPIWGFGGNSSVNGTTMSLLAIASLASSVPYLNYIGWIAGVLAAIRSKGSAGIGSVVIASIVFFLYRYPLIVSSVLVSIIISTPLWWNISKKYFSSQAPLILFGRKMHPFFSLSHRDTLWKQAWCELYRDNKHPWFGIGAGAFSYMFPVFQVKRNEKLGLPTKGMHLIPWLHSDVLQWMIEGGRLGSILLVFSIAEVGYMSYFDNFSMAFFVCFLVNSLVNFPTKSATDSLVFIMFLKRLLM